MGNACALCHIRAGLTALQCFQYGVWRKCCMVSLLDHPKLCWRKSHGSFECWVAVAPSRFLSHLLSRGCKYFVLVIAFMGDWVCILLGLTKQKLSYPRPTTFC
ncbi:hypothetical protein SVAN01_05666 [Stagonosporopsis vannaccii]|nr:hypothetical protein SVAN01_05666 [Stagonosporopsis vannaccii]